MQLLLANLDVAVAECDAEAGVAEDAFLTVFAVEVDAKEVAPGDFVASSADDV